jgi:hypothetical protein
LPKGRRKKQRDFKRIKQQETETHKSAATASHDNRLKVSEKIKAKIHLEFSDVLGEFKMDVQNFVEYVDRIVDNKRNIADFILEEDRDYEQVEPSGNNSNDRLYRACIDILIYNKDNSLIPKRRMVRDRFEQEQEFYVASLVDTYLKKEDEQRSEIKDEIFKAKVDLQQHQDEAEEIIIKYEEEDENENENNKKKIDYDLLIPWTLRLIEFVLIICYLLFNHLFINTVEISEINYFADRMKAVFEDKSPCITSLVEVQSPSGMNEWIYDCYMPT